jgi:hypothetical protein
MTDDIIKKINGSHVNCHIIKLNDQNYEWVKKNEMGTSGLIKGNTK